MVARPAHADDVRRWLCSTHLIDLIDLIDVIAGALLGTTAVMIAAATLLQNGAARHAADRTEIAHRPDATPGHNSSEATASWR